jgi:uncharacterized protein with PQ loop repeat
MSLEWLGFAGTTLVVFAYLPQIAHLLRAKCAAGVSLSAYLVWTSSALLLLVYALTTSDPVFITLQGYQLLALGLIFALSLKHHRCDQHCGHRGGVNASPPSGTVGLARGRERSSHS